MKGYSTWKPRPVEDKNTSALGDKLVSSKNENYMTMYLSITYNVPWAPSSAEKSSTGGVRIADTFSSLWRRTDGMSLNDAGVDPVICACSSGEIYGGKEEIRVTGGILDRAAELTEQKRRTGHITTRGTRDALHTHAFVFNYGRAAKSSRRVP